MGSRDWINWRRCSISPAFKAGGSGLDKLEAVSEEEETDENKKRQRPLGNEMIIKPSSAKKMKGGGRKRTKRKKKGQIDGGSSSGSDSENESNGSSNGVRISSEPPKTEFVEVPQDEVDIRGEYFDEADQLNVIERDFKVKLANSQSVLAMEPEGKSDEVVLSLSVDLVKTKQTELLDDALVEALMDQELLDGDEKIIKCNLDAGKEELVWESGHIWFKKDWSVLVGAWTDPDNNLIEIRKDNTLRYIDGYGPFEGEFIGFKKLHVKMPNGEFMEGHLLEDKQIKWQNDEMWNRCTDQGCLIM